MTKLEELRAAADAAYDTYPMLVQHLRDDEAVAVFDARWDDFWDAQDAFLDELLKKQEENE